MLYLLITIYERLFSHFGNEKKYSFQYLKLTKQIKSSSQSIFERIQPNKKKTNNVIDRSVGGDLLDDIRYLKTGAWAAGTDAVYSPAASFVAD